MVKLTDHKELAMAAKIMPITTAPPPPTLTHAIRILSEPDRCIFCGHHKFPGKPCSNEPQCHK